MAAAETPSAAELFGPLPAPINGAKVLDDVSEVYRRFLVITESQAHILALWTAHTWCADAAYYTPYINVTSATPRCGKSMVSDVAELLVKKPMKAGGLSKAVLIRLVAEKVTLLLDELDQLLKADKELAAAITGVLNYGFSRHGVYPILEPTKGGTWKVTSFPV